MTFISFSRSQWHFETLILIEKSLCAHYTCILNQWLKFYQTSTDRWLGHRKEVIRFWWPWPHFQGHYIIKTLKMILVCTLISWINRWNLTKLAQIFHWDRVKKWLDFSDLDLISKVTLALCGGYLISIAYWHFFHFIWNTSDGWAFNTEKNTGA